FLRARVQHGRLGSRVRPCGLPSSPAPDRASAELADPQSPGLRGRAQTAAALSPARRLRLGGPEIARDAHAAPSPDDGEPPRSASRYGKLTRNPPPRPA